MTRANSSFNCEGGGGCAIMGPSVAFEPSNAIARAEKSECLRSLYFGTLEGSRIMNYLCEKRQSLLDVIMLASQRLSKLYASRPTAQELITSTNQALKERHKTSTIQCGRIISRLQRSRNFFRIKPGALPQAFSSRALGAVTPSLTVGLLPRHSTQA